MKTKIIPFFVLSIIALSHISLNIEDCNCTIICPNCKSMEVNHTHYNGLNYYYGHCRTCGFDWDSKDYL